MAFHFKQNEAPAHAIQRICRERLEVARKWLRQGGRPKAIHGVRKEIKRLRAVLHLLDRGNDEGRCRRLKKKLRFVAKHLAAARDARVMLRAFEKLTADERSQYAEIADQLRRESRRETRRLCQADAVGQAKRKLRKCKERVKDLKIQGEGWPAVEFGVRETYRLGRQAWKKVCRTPSAETFHAWRKHVKVLTYHLELLCPDWPASRCSTQRQLDRLGEILGEDHDLALLEHFVLSQRSAFHQSASALSRMITCREKKLRVSALKLGAALFAEPPAGFSRQLGREWKAWRSPR